MRGEGDKIDNTRRRVLKGLLELQKVKKIACVLIWTTDFGTSFFGTEKLKVKAQKSFDCTCICTCGHGSANSWQHELEDDEKALIENGPAIDDNTTDLLNQMYVDTPVEKLPLKLDLMVYNDLSKWIRKQILKDRHERGYSGRKIVYKDMTWKPSFWPEDLCDWREVCNFAHWKKEDVTCGTDLTTILKRAVELRLRSKGIDPADHVAGNVDARKQKRKQKWRGIHSNPTVISQELGTVHAGSDNNSGNSNDDNDEDEVYRGDTGDVGLGHRELDRSTNSQFSEQSLESLSAPNAEDMAHEILDDDEEDASVGERVEVGDSENEASLGASWDVEYGGLDRSTNSQTPSQFLESLSAPNFSFIETSRPSSRRVSVRSSVDDDVFLPSPPHTSCSSAFPRYPDPSPQSATRAPSSQPLLSNTSFVQSSRPSLNSGPVSSANGGNGDIVAKRHPRRLRPSEMNNPELYQYKKTIQISSSKRPRNELYVSNSSSWNRYNSLKNVRDVTTGQLDIGTLPISVSPELVDMFLAVSEINTSNKIETGGLLGGILEDSRRFVVTELIIPNQIGRRDFWEACDAPQIQEYFTAKELIILGSIHTHPPPAESFLSSVDLHQQFDFQKDIPSAISIVIAPAHMPQNVPAFAYSLTDLGLTVLADCKRAGFHQHRERSGASHRLYKDADHLTWSPDINTFLADLREV